MSASWLPASCPSMAVESPARRRAPVTDENTDSPRPGDKRSRWPSPIKQAASSRQRGPLSPSRLTNLSAAAAGSDSPAVHEHVPEPVLHGAGEVMASSAPATNGEWVVACVGGWRLFVDKHFLPL